MKNQKLLATLITGLTLACITGCATSSGLSEKEVDQKIAAAIALNNKTMKEDILAKVDSELKEETSKITSLSDQQKNDLYNSIMKSVKEEISQISINAQSSEQPIQNLEENYYATNSQYITNTSQYNTTNNTYESSTTNIISNVTSEQKPQKIVDGTVIPVEIEFPYTYTFYEQNFVFDNIEVYAYNHESEPYREIEYPYELRIVASGIYEPLTDGPFVSSMSFLPLTFTPHDTIIYLGMPIIDKGNNTFTLERTLTVNAIPDRILIK